ncbi:ADP-heptose--LPS heptosyltransferase 2 [bacterium BMS3Bbin03]|nr:ADP-heptose--LPS heptosyltransferase 2 [bacterium BMS3Bbin03]
MKLLLIRFSAIGDVILTTPAIRMLADRFPRAQIDIVTKPELKALLEPDLRLNRIYTLPHPFSWKKLFRLGKELRKNHYNWVIDWQKHTKSYVLSRLAGGKIKRYPKFSVQRFFLVYFKKSYYRKIVPVPLRYLQAVRHLNVRDDGRGLELSVPETVEKTALLKLRFKPGTYWVLAPGGGRATKRWPAPYFKKLASLIQTKLGLNLVLVGGKNDFAFCKAAQNGNAAAVQNLCGETSLPETVAILKNASGLVTNDTGVMHAAAAFQKPVVAIFGPTVKEFGFFPFRTPNIVLEKQLPCRPCSFHGTEKCPLDHFQCMVNISPEEVFKAVAQFRTSNQTDR